MSDTTARAGDVPDERSETIQSSSVAAPSETAAPAQAPAKLGSVVPKMFGIDARLVPPILITLILLVGEFTFHFLESWQRTALAICAAIAAEMILGKLFTAKWPHPASAYISGIS